MDDVRETRTVAILTALAVLAALASAACAGGPRPETRPVSTGWSQEGTASWYGPGFHGKATASGETYDMDGMTAAHRSLPFGTWVKVVNRRNGRDTRVRITDRGPFVEGRILDLSRAAARDLGMIGDGTAPVRLEVVALPSEAACRLVQVGAFERRRNAEELARRLEDRGAPVRLEPGPGSLTRVVIGPYADAEAARRAVRTHGGLVRDCPRPADAGTGLSRSDHAL